MKKIINVDGDEVALLSLTVGTQVNGKEPRVFGSPRTSFNILNNDFTKEIFDSNLPGSKHIQKNSNVRLFSSNTDTTIKINDDVVLIDIFPHYGHFLLDGIGKFLYIHKYNNNVKPFFTNIQIQDNPVQSNHRRVFPEILNKFSNNYPVQDYLPITKDTNSHLFKNIYGFPGTGKSDEQTSFNNPIIYSLLRDLFLPKRKSLKNKNIFVSRLKSSLRYTENIELMEKKFAEFGYEIIYCENLSFEEQINIFYDAKNIVAFAGTSLVNLLFANEDANVIEFYSDESYFSWEWRVITKHLNINYLDIYFGKDNTNVIFKILSQIDNLFDTI